MFYNFSESETSNQDHNPTQKKRVYCWREKEPLHLHMQVAQNNFIPDDVIQWTPLKYFSSGVMRLLIF